MIHCTKYKPYRSNANYELQL